MKVAEPEVRELSIKQLVMDPQCQMRMETSWITIQEYGEAMEDGAEFPPAIVFGRLGGKQYLADGWHRVLAAKKIGKKTFPCEVRDGGLREAMLYAAGANTHHGLRRTNKDKQIAVNKLLGDREWRVWADAEIARRCNVSGPLVAKMRQRLEEMGSKQPTHRLHFNGRGDLQYRKVNNELTEAPAPKTMKCPYCGNMVPVE